MKFRDLVRTFFFTLFALICFIQCYTIMKSFFEYPYVIGMYDVSPDLVTILPGVTVCNNNRLSLKKLMLRNILFREEMKERFPNWTLGQRFVNPKEFNGFRDGVAKIFAKMKYNPQEELDNVTMVDSFNLKPDRKPFINWVGCASTWNNSIECELLSHIDTIQDRICTTILHRGSMAYDMVHNPQYFNSTEPQQERRYSYFNSKEVVKIELNFEPEDYGDLKRQIGSRIIFHGNNYVASSSDPDYFVTRGYKYDFNIYREDILMGDRVAGCIPYEEENLSHYREEVNPRLPLYGDTCFQNCVVRNVIHRSNCWPTTMPYYRNDSYDSNFTLKSCPWFREPPYFSIYRELLRVEKLIEDLKLQNQTLSDDDGIDTGTNSSSTAKGRPINGSTSGNMDAFASGANINNYKEELKAYMRIRRHCWTKCPRACRITKYSVTVTKSPWPSDIGIQFDKSDEKRLLRHCCALVTIKYSHFYYNVHEFMPKYNLVDTLGNVGGLLAVWLNLSMVEFYHAIQKLVELCAEQSFYSQKIHVDADHYTSDRLFLSSSKQM